jgi:long-chain fatty acid transport protein
MPISPFARRLLPVLIIPTILLGLFAGPTRAQYGLSNGGVGPINYSMGGAATAAPLDSAGALYWNPATITALGNEMEVGTSFLDPRTSITSKVSRGAFGLGLPTSNLAGTTGGNNGVFLLPTVGIVYKPSADSRVTYGFGIFEIGGFGVNYPVDPRNPVLNPQIPFGRGVGPLYTQLQLFQFSPSVAWKLSDTLSIGLQGNIDYGLLSANPGLFAMPTLVPTPLGPAPNYPNATQGRSRAGGGFQVGLYWAPEGDWSFGASFKSPQWFERYTFNAVSPTTGKALAPSESLDFPLTVSAGFAYRGIDRLTWATDFRYLDYRGTNGFRRAGFDEHGVLQGLGWQSIFGLGTGLQYMATDALALRAGYIFSMNPVGPALTALNLGSPTIIMHTLALGASYNMAKNFKISLAYAHNFQNQISGPLIQPGVGAVPGTSVRTAATADYVLIGATVAF